MPTQPLVANKQSCKAFECVLKKSIGLNFWEEAEVHDALGANREIDRGRN